MNRCSGLYRDQKIFVLRCSYQVFGDAEDWAYQKLMKSQL